MMLKCDFRLDGFGELTMGFEMDHIRSEKLTR